MKYQRGMDNGGADKILSASLELVCSISCTDADVVALRLNNIGSSALTGFELRAKVSRDAPADALPVANWTTDDGLVITRPASASPVTLASSGKTRLSVNVSDSTDLEIWASGAGARLAVEAGIYSAGV